MDTIINMSETIREKEDKDYSGYYWQWLCRCNMQIGAYLRVKKLYHGHLHYRDIMSAIDSVENFTDEYWGSDDTQSGMNCYEGAKWVLDFLRTMETYQLIIHSTDDEGLKNAWYRDYQNWYWTSEVLANYYYQVFLGGDSGSGSMSSMEVDGVSKGLCRLRRAWLMDDFYEMNGPKAISTIRYRNITMNDFETIKRRCLINRISSSDNQVQRNLDRERISDASDSLTHVLYRWIICREHIASDIVGKRQMPAFRHATQRIKWNVYCLLNNDMNVEKLMPKR